MSKVIFSEKDGHLSFFCTGCRCVHTIVLKHLANPSQVHRFDGNLKSPTVAPSVRIDYGLSPSNYRKVCHFFLSEGVVHYQDCWHSLKNTSVPLEDFKYYDKPDKTISYTA